MRKEMLKGAVANQTQAGNSMPAMTQGATAKTTPQWRRRL